MLSQEKLWKEGKKVAWEDRLFHSNWEARSEAYINLASIFKSITDPKDPRIFEFSHFFKKTVAEGNVHVQLKAFDALIAYLRVADADVGRLFGKEVCDAIVAAKCLWSTRKTVDKAKEVLLLWVELGAVDAFLDAMEKAIKNKKSKAVVPAIDVMINALRKFGAEIVSPIRILKMLPELYNHQDRMVRLCSQVKDLEEEVAKQSRKIRTSNIMDRSMHAAANLHPLKNTKESEQDKETIAMVMGPGPAKVYVPDVVQHRNVMERLKQPNLTKTEKEYSMLWRPNNLPKCGSYKYQASGEGIRLDKKHELYTALAVDLKTSQKESLEIEKELQKKVDELGDATQTIKNLRSEIEKLKNEKSSIDKTNKDLRKLLEVERKRCEDSEKNNVDAGTQVEGLRSQVKGLEYEVAQLKSEKVSLQGEIDYLKKGVVEASVGFAVDFVTFFVEGISQVKVKAP